MNAELDTHLGQLTAAGTTIYVCTWSMQFTNNGKPFSDMKANTTYLEWGAIKASDEAHSSGYIVLPNFPKPRLDLWNCIIHLSLHRFILNQRIATQIRKIRFNFATCRHIWHTNFHAEIVSLLFPIHSAEGCFGVAQHTAQKEGFVGPKERYVGPKFERGKALTLNFQPGRCSQ